MSRLIELFEWIESKPAGSNIGSYDSKGNPTSVGCFASGDRYCVLGQFRQETLTDVTTSAFVSSFGDIIGDVINAYDEGLARTREQYLNLLAPFLPDEYKFTPPTLPAKETASVPELQTAHR